MIEQRKKDKEGRTMPEEDKRVMTT